MLIMLVQTLLFFTVVLLVVDVDLLDFQGKSCVFQNKLTIFFVDDCGICTMWICNKRFRIMFWTPHDYNLSFLFNMCEFTFSVPFTWCAQTSTTQQTRNKSCTKNTKRTNIQTHNKGITIHIKRLQKNITISTINSHILQKKKILQTEIHKHTSNF